MYSAIFTPYITCMISGVPKPFSAMWRAIGTIRSARELALHSASTTGRLGWMNPIAAPSTQRVRGPIGAFGADGASKKLPVRGAFAERIRRQMAR